MNIFKIYFTFIGITHNHQVDHAHCPPSREGTNFHPTASEWVCQGIWFCLGGRAVCPTRKPYHCRVCPPTGNALGLDWRPSWSRLLPPTRSFPPTHSPGAQSLPSTPTLSSRSAVLIFLEISVSLVVWGVGAGSANSL